MRFRAGFAIGAATGYYFGTKAGRRRYIQLSRALRRVRESESMGTAAEKVKAVIDLTKERARDVFESTPTNSDYELVDVTTTFN